MNERLVALRAVGVVNWLRRHPLVEGGPGVRATQALADVARARIALGGPPARDADPDAAFLVALSTSSAPISAPRNAAAVSVVKNGLPVPAAKITTLPSSRYCKALGRT
jgi:hypothetical protein